MRFILLLCLVAGLRASFASAAAAPLSSPGTDPVATYNALKATPLNEYFPSTIADPKNDVAATTADPAEQKKFDQAYANYVHSMGNLGFFGEEGNVSEVLDHNPARDAYLTWFKDNEATLINRSQVKRFPNETMQDILRASYDVYNLQRYAKDNDQKGFLTRQVAYLNSPYLQVALNVGHSLADNPVSTWVGAVISGALIAGPAATFINNLLNKLTEAPMQWASMSGAKLWKRPAVMLNKLLTPSAKTAGKQIAAGENALARTNQLAAELNFEGMTPAQGAENWERLKQYCIEINQVFAETPSQIGNGRGMMFAFSMDAHRTYSTSLASYHMNFEQHRQRLLDEQRNIEERFAANSDIRVRELRLAMMKETDPDYANQKAKLAEAKQGEAAAARERSEIEKQIVRAKYDLESISKQNQTEEYTKKSKDFEDLAKSLGKKAGLTDAELAEIIYNAGEIRLAQRQSAVTAAEWIYFAFYHPEVRKLAARGAFGKNFMEEYNTVRDWLGYNDYLLANQEDLKLLLDHLRFKINLETIIPAKEAFLASGGNPKKLPFIARQAFETATDPLQAVLKSPVLPSEEAKGQALKVGGACDVKFSGVGPASSL